MSRLDQELVERGLCESREKAKRAVMAGTVRINGQSARKPSDAVKPGDALSLDVPPRSLSAAAATSSNTRWNIFNWRSPGLTAIDLGASTGGFTDCLLQRGAQKVYRRGRRPRPA